MPARSTTKTRPPAKKMNAKTRAKNPAAKKKPSGSGTKPVARKPAATKAKARARKATAPKSKAGAKKAMPAGRKPVAKTASKRAAKPGTITVGETQYVLGEYGQLMTIDEYERAMGKKSSG